MHVNFVIRKHVLQSARDLKKCKNFTPRGKYF